MSHRRVVACIPAYNEESHIASILIQVRNFVDEVIVCDDGSLDLTAEIVEALGVNLIKHKANKGYGSALQSLFKEALDIGADIVVTIDADNQHDPRELTKLVTELSNGNYDVVIGSRFILESNSNMPSWRKNGIRILTAISRNGMNISDSQSGFRAYTRKALETLNLTESGMGISTEILIKASESGLNIGEVPIRAIYIDEPKRSPVIHGLLVLLSTIRHLSIRHPLIVYGIPGVISCLLSVLLWGYILLIYTDTGVFVIGYSLAALTFTMAGLSLVSNAIIIWVMLKILKDKN